MREGVREGVRKGVWDSGRKGESESRRGEGYGEWGDTV